MHKSGIIIFLLIVFSLPVQAGFLIPMDSQQKNHLKAYGLVYHILEKKEKLSILLNYRGGSFLYDGETVFETQIKSRGVTIEFLSSAGVEKLRKREETGSFTSLNLQSAPRIAIYKPPSTLPWDDAVNMALDYAEIPYTRIYNPEILQGQLKNYDWLHLHHEDFTGQFGKFFSFARNLQWYQQSRLKYEAMASDLGFSRVADLKKEVARNIQSFVANGGFLFAMCSSTDTIDIALAAQNIDIVDPSLDRSPVTPDFNSKLDFSRTFAFQNFEVFTDPFVYEYSNIDINPQSTGILENEDVFALFEFDAEIDPIPSLLTQNHVRVIKGFLGQTTAFVRDKIKPRITILGETPGTNRIKYIYGSYEKGFFSFYGGHDPEDYQHLVGDAPTNLDLHRNSPGYRLILNNIFLPAAQNKKLKT